MGEEFKDFEVEAPVLTLEPDLTEEKEEIVAKEKEANELKRNYFGPQGELFKKRESLMKPIQEEIFTAVQTLANEKDYQLILDKSSNMSLIFASPKIDVSDAVLEKLGYSK